MPADYKEKPRSVLLRGDEKPNRRILPGDSFFRSKTSLTKKEGKAAKAEKE
jgi:hypothetical protein